MEALIKEIHALEQGHKKGEGERLQALVIKRNELKDLLDQEMRRNFNRIAKERYVWGNNLARILKKIEKEKTLNYIEKIKKRTWGMVFSTAALAKVFQNYYWSLYSIKQKGQ